MSARAPAARDAARSVLTQWRTKALLQKALSSLPAGQQVNYLLQRRLTHGIPIPDGRLLEAIDGARRHVDAFGRQAAPADPADATFFEFGAGWDLHIPLTLFALGVGSQVVVDLTPHARADLVADVVARLFSADALDERARSRLRDAFAAAGTSGDVKAMAACFGITYRAPADARATELPAGSVDCVTSTSTLEHIPQDDIGLVLDECRRILRPGGVASFLIDYSDHYSQFDASITAYNFLRYSDRHWRWYNSSLQYQNRLRHSQYMAMFRGAGLEVLEERPTVPEGGVAALRTVPVAAPFRDFDPVDLATTAAHVVLRKAG